MKTKYLIWLACIISLTGCSRTDNQNVPIDRHALVSRYNVVLTQADTLGALSVGNGNFAFTVDVSGLQSFPEDYEHGIPLGTQSQWGWHSLPNTSGYTIEDVLTDYETCNEKRIPVAIQHRDGRPGGATHWLRANPHRLHLGLVSLMLLKENGQPAQLGELRNIHQELDLWNGAIVSSYTLEDIPVRVELYGHQDLDLVAFHIASPLIAQNRLKVRLQFPYGKECHVCPGYDWEHPEKHESRIAQQNDQGVWIQRILDSTTYAAGLQWEKTGAFARSGAHVFELTPGDADSSFECSVLFTEAPDGAIPGFNATRANSEDAWEQFWMQGAAIDFSKCTDPRAPELERRVILSQYLTRIQCAGMYPPQETGLTFNSWYGKFHLEMHWWHGVHFALWNRIELLEKSMPWYEEILARAHTSARRQGFAGVRWPKMTGPDGQSSPSSVGEFLIWQQPHPIYFAELFYREDPTAETLERFREMVFATANFMASFAQYDSSGSKYHLCHPLIPAQEIFPAIETDDPPFELAYWHYGLSVAQEWRKRMGMAHNAKWQDVIDNLAPLPVAAEMYLPAAGASDAYSDPIKRRDHPMVSGVYGMLPGCAALDTAIMTKTLREIMRHWNWETTWGWDYPMLAMCAARLGQPEMAIDALLMDTQKNTYLVNGHNYQDQRLRIYLPGNGGLLTAVAMMAAGWDGAAPGQNPGFPEDGTWDVRWEGLQRLP